MVLIFVKKNILILFLYTMLANNTRQINIQHKVIVDNSVVWLFHRIIYICQF